MQKPNSYIVFKCKDTLFAFDIAFVYKPALLQSIHSLPHIDNGRIAGISNIGGEIVVVANLPKILGLSTGEIYTQSPKMSIVCIFDKLKVAFLVDDIFGVVNAECEPYDDENAMFECAAFDYFGSKCLVLDAELLETAIERRYL